MRGASRPGLSRGGGGAPPRRPPPPGRRGRRPPPPAPPPRGGGGAGRPGRLGAVETALPRAAERATMSCLASDAYFPFADAIQLAAERGVTAIIQPGGSRRDEMAIEGADRPHMAMGFPGRRPFRPCRG